VSIEFAKWTAADLRAAGCNSWSVGFVFDAEGFSIALFRWHVTVDWGRA
jgi:hypothetical protein